MRLQHDQQFRNYKVYHERAKDLVRGDSAEDTECNVRDAALLLTGALGNFSPTSLLPGLQRLDTKQVLGSSTQKIHSCNAGTLCC